MVHFYEKNIVEIKNEYTAFLVNILRPCIYQQFLSTYKYAQDLEKQYKEKTKVDQNVKNPGVLKIFQLCLKDIPTINRNIIETIVSKIKEGCKCADWFDDLIKAVVKSNIVLLTYSSSTNQSNIVKEKYHERVDTCDFIHKCFIETSNVLYNRPELFWHDLPSLDIKKNQIEIYEIIQLAILNAVRKVLPVKLILQEYLKNDYVETNNPTMPYQIPDSKYREIKQMVKNDIHENNQTSDNNFKEIKIREDDDIKSKLQKIEHSVTDSNDKSHSNSHSDDKTLSSSESSLDLGLNSDKENDNKDSENKTPENKDSPGQSISGREISSDKNKINTPVSHHNVPNHPLPPTPQNLTKTPNQTQPPMLFGGNDNKKKYFDYLK